MNINDDKKLDMYVGIFALLGHASMRTYDPLKYTLKDKPSACKADFLRLYDAVQICKKNAKNYKTSVLAKILRLDDGFEFCRACKRESLKALKNHKFYSEFRSSVLLKTAALKITALTFIGITIEMLMTIYNSMNTRQK